MNGILIKNQDNLIQKAFRFDNRSRVIPHSFKLCWKLSRYYGKAWLSRFTRAHLKGITLQDINFTPCFKRPRLVVSTIGSSGLKQWQHLPEHLIHGKPPDAPGEESWRIIQGVKLWSGIRFLLRIPNINHYGLLIANLSLVSNNAITAWQWITHLNYIKVMDLPLCSTSALATGRKREREKERETTD